MLVEARDLSYGTPDGKILARDLNFEVSPEDLLVVSGPNGSGKSTLLRVLLKQLKPLSGKLQLRVEPQAIGILPQLQNTEFHLPMTLRDVLEVSTGRALDKKEVTRLGLLDERHLDLAWNTASGGERKRTLLTRILLNPPALLLLDEPMNHLDKESQGRVASAIFAFLKDPGRGHGVVLVSHGKSLNAEGAGVRVKHLRVGGSVEEEISA